MQFSSEQRGQVFQAIDEAEVRTARYYCIPPFRWERLAYDLLTRQDHEWSPLPDPVLAKVQCMQKLGSLQSKSFDFYRIQLNDPAILSVVERESLGPSFYPLMIYILTHEMVHMVRHSTIFGSGQPEPLWDETEEQRVLSISRQIMADGIRPELSSYLDKFCSPHL
jgi:hypothetical protein